ncbi:hypothetical protein C8R44DRAFT_351937 [Mycena epipterygia]|nr:hypothetical protein C8R44DRAFT_351937 [Mycena epipterygia]
MIALYRWGLLAIYISSGADCISSSKVHCHVRGTLLAHFCVCLTVHLSRSREAISSAFIISALFCWLARRQQLRRRNLQARSASRSCWIFGEKTGAAAIV